MEEPMPIEEAICVREPPIEEEPMRPERKFILGGRRENVRIFLEGKKRAIKLIEYVVDCMSEASTNGGQNLVC
jgi:hypothetical protein